MISHKKNMRDKSFNNSPIILINESFEVNESNLEMAPKKELTDKFIRELNLGLSSASPRIADLSKISQLQNDIADISSENTINLNWDLLLFQNNTIDNYDENDYKKDFDIIEQQRKMKFNNSSAMGILFQNQSNNRFSSGSGSGTDSNNEESIAISRNYSNDELSEISGSSNYEEYKSDNEESTQISSNNYMTEDENTLNIDDYSENITVGTSRSNYKRKKLFQPKYMIDNMIIYKSSKNIN